MHFRTWPVWLSGLERGLENRKVVGSIPDRGTHLVAGSFPSHGRCGRQPTDVSLSHCRLSPSLSPSLPRSPKSLSRSSCEGFYKCFPPVSSSCFSVAAKTASPCPRSVLYLLGGAGLERSSSSPGPQSAGSGLWRAPVWGPL